MRSDQWEEVQPDEAAGPMKQGNNCLPEELECDQAVQQASSLFPSHYKQLLFFWSPLSQLLLEAPHPFCETSCLLVKSFLWFACFINRSKIPDPLRGTSNIMQFAPFVSDIELPFYTSLASHKINHDKLDDSARKLLGLYEIRTANAPEHSCRMQIHGNALTSDE